MATDYSFSRLWHLKDACSGYFRALEAFVHSEAKHEWKTIRETALHLGKHAINPLITYRAEFFCLFVARRKRFLPRFSAGGSTGLSSGPLGYSRKATLVPAKRPFLPR